MAYVIVQFGDTGGHAVLIENKVTAPLSLNQAEDYHRRGAALVSEGRCAVYKTCILAPSAWFDVYPSHGFDHAFTYEDAAKTIGDGEGPRARWRAEVFRQGARRARRKLTFSNEQTAFFLRAYYDFAEAHSPELKTKQSTGLKSTIIVYPLSLEKELGLGRYLDVQHNIQEQRMKIAISFASLVSVEAALAEVINERGWAIAQNGRRVDVIAEVPEISVDTPIAAQVRQLGEALGIAKDMLNIVRSEADRFRSIAVEV